jgi:chromosome segregation ATPase
MSETMNLLFERQFQARKAQLSSCAVVAAQIDEQIDSLEAEIEETESAYPDIRSASIETQNRHRVIVSEFWRMVRLAD